MLRLLLLFVAVGLASLPTTIKTIYGQIDGTRDILTGVRSWKGVPFASPPVGPLRFRPPVPPQSWSGVKETKTFQADCIQWHNSSGLAFITSEDCLYLNIWAPDKISKPLPVMLFFYGGSWSWGGTQMVLYDGGRILAKRKDVIIVTTNYRLGLLGFFAGAALGAESGNGASGNYGLLDQRRAMQWIHDNIAAFGGDPSRLTIWGESAGAGSVTTHLVMKNSWPHFTQAIVESGPAAPWIARPMNVMQAVYDGVVQQFNCTSGGSFASQLQCLRSLSPYALMQANNIGNYEQSASNVSALNTLTWGPVVDGVELLDHPVTLFQQGKVARVPLMVGTNLNEGTMLIPHLSYGATDAQYRQWCVQELGPYYGPMAYQQYPTANYASPWWAGTYCLTDAFMLCPSHQMGDSLSSLGIPVYIYQFTHVWDEISWDKKLGVFHASELIAVFAMKDGIFEMPNHQIVPILLSPREYKMIDYFVNYWVSFGTSGNPNTSRFKDSIVWPQYNSTTRNSIRLDLELGIQQNQNGQKCAFWSTINLLTNPAN